MNHGLTQSILTFRMDEILYLLHETVVMMIIRQEEETNERFAKPAKNLGVSSTVALNYEKIKLYIKTQSYTEEKINTSESSQCLYIRCILNTKGHKKGSILKSYSHT